MSSIREVALAAGVSIATVSRALSTPEKVSKNTLERVNAAIDKMDYRPNMMARNFRAARSYSIVVLVPNIANTFFSTAIRGIQSSAHKAGYAVILGNTNDSLALEKEYVNFVRTRQSDGTIQLRPHSSGSLITPELNTPVVSVCGRENSPHPSVRIDNIAAAQTLVEHLINQGHQRIGVIAGNADDPHTMDRKRGYCQAIERAGISFDETLISYGDFTLCSGVIAANHFVSMAHRPTAIFSMNDEMAIGALQSFRSAGLNPPKDFSIAGFDNIEFSKYTEPPLTTIAQPAEELGKTAFHVLLQLIEEQELPSNDIVLPYELIVRESTQNALGEL
ncbi:LacI family DNA-binding transcriptional regulator [Marinagarivorans cellulosilyticus]|uniref:LacI family transcriptional regulator, repressor for deo operon, udp, cdd, tsx, nupC, and nupG n=1 Tax=Marinagarivorans cellulosilyticus TaxID=2721545 RepID=A0AAN1WJL0_9GAMM|nr:LacI family DNA-binding transcriptional regulator [Marinagarivorans cellulosilyticus]BCD98765.1 LacI family transcriptional regulator, repressor for deo operon, udp, cdd, tsx, nupC, and nupG [Marinagarivorans cellulosilyticus]